MRTPWLAFPKWLSSVLFEMATYAKFLIPGSIMTNHVELTSQGCINCTVPCLLESSCAGAWR